MPDKSIFLDSNVGSGYIVNDKLKLYVIINHLVIR